MISPWNLGGVAVIVDFLPPILWPVAMREKLLGNQNWGEMARLRNHVWWSNSDNSGRVPENRHHSWLWSGPERRNNPWIAASPRPVASVAPGRRSKAPFPSRQNSTRRRDSRLRLLGESAKHRGSWWSENVGYPLLVPKFVLQDETLCCQGKSSWFLLYQPRLPRCFMMQLILFKNLGTSNR